MTNLLISYPDIPFRAETISTSPSTSASYPVENSITGERGLRWETASASTQQYITYDMGSGNSGAANHFIVARANLLSAQSSTMTARFFGGDSTPTDSSITSALTPSAIGLVGPRSEDIIKTFSDTDYRYYRFRLDDSGSFTAKLSKVYLGTFFDFGREPIYGATQSRKVIIPGARDAVYQFSLSWKGITNSKRNELFDKILQYRDVNPVFLYDTNDLILNGIRLLHCRVLDASVTPVTAQYSDIDITFEELI